MTDRELLKFAAKAAGLRVGFEPNGVERGRYDLYWSYARNQLYWHGKTAGCEYPEPVSWNPLTDDGDALRLAVKVGMRDYFGIEVQERCTQCSAFEPWEHCEFEEHGTDPYAATRRAIVRAAAEIGKAMP
jgi:hypothetical protein